MVSSQTRVLKELYLLPQASTGGLEEEEEDASFLKKNCRCWNPRRLGAGQDTSFYYQTFLETRTAKECRVCDVL
jgi:hypothetical protein